MAYQNLSESRFSNLAESKGWNVTKRGWPDFLCWDKDGNPFAVEVKPKYGKRQLRLRREQDVCMRFLQSQGVRCFLSDGRTLQPFDPEKHGYRKPGKERERVPKAAP